MIKVLRMLYLEISKTLCHQDTSATNLRSSVCAWEMDVNVNSIIYVHTPQLCLFHYRSFYRKMLFVKVGVWNLVRV